MAVFRCKRSGNSVSFHDLNDIASMRMHEGYEEILNEGEKRQEAPKEVLIKAFNVPVMQVQKRRGRPPKGRS